MNVENIDSNFSINIAFWWFPNGESNTVIAANARKTSALQPLFLC